MPTHTKPVRNKPARKPQRDNQTLLIGAGVVGIAVVVLLIAINVISTSGNSGTQVNAAGRLWGNPNAPVAIEEWSDFQ